MLGNCGSLNSRAPALLFGFTRKIGCAGYPVTLCYDSRVLVGTGVFANDIAKLLAFRGIEGWIQTEPVVKISRRGFDNECCLCCRCPGFVLVGVTVDDQRENPKGILDSTAFVSSQLRTHGSAFHVNIVPGCGEIDSVCGH